MTLLEIASIAIPAVPLTARALAWRAEASKATAEAQRLSAEAEKKISDTVQQAMGTLAKRLDEVSEAHAQCEENQKGYEAKIERFERRAQSDAELIGKFSERLEHLERVNGTQRAELAELRRVIQSGGVHG